MSNKKELQVAALENGTVIDHIPSDKLFTVVSLLDTVGVHSGLLAVTGACLKKSSCKTSNG